MSNLLSKKVLTFVAVVAVVVVAVLLIINRSKKVEAPSITAPKTAQVSMGESGFSPETLKIKVGTTVIWKNSGAGTFRVVSNPHPEHSDLPGLDSKTNISANGTYTYAFTKAGTFHYHNENEPDQNGIIVVE